VLGDLPTHSPLASAGGPPLSTKCPTAACAIPASCQILGPIPRHRPTRPRERHRDWPAEQRGNRSAVPPSPLGLDSVHSSVQFRPRSPSEHARESAPFPTRGRETSRFVSSVALGCAKSSHRPIVSVRMGGEEEGDWSGVLSHKATHRRAMPLPHSWLQTCSAVFFASAAEAHLSATSDCPSLHLRHERAS
jgi:hypothetical protein